MIHSTLGIVALLATTPPTTSVAPLSQQEQLDARYDRALAAGYKALFLCSAIANAERNGTTRTPESVHEWELTGIYPRLDAIIRELPYEIMRLRPAGDPGAPSRVSHVSVSFADDIPARVAVRSPDGGCSVLPIGAGLSGLPELKVERPVADTARPELRDGPIRDVVLGAFTQDGPRTTAAVVMKDGTIIAERYANGFGPATPQRTWSVAKSIAATLVGAAVYRGETVTGRSAGLGLAMNDLRSTITIDHSLRMASGRYSDTPGNRTDPLYWGGTTVDERAQNWALAHRPGTVYRYANNDTLAAVKAIEEGFAQHPPADFLKRVGMHSTVAETDWQGNYVLSSQVWSTARDLARLGQLHLDGGVLPDGTRVLPEGWSDYVSDPSGPQPEGSQWGYGAGWWTFRRPEGNAFEGIPDDAFAARGNRGQYVVVVPSRNVVIVRRGEDMVGKRFDIVAFTRDILASLD